MQRGDIVAGKYRLHRPLGSGGMAEVWAATNTFTERHVAIKFMNEEVAKTPEAAARFLKEAKVSARVDHPNIIDILDVGQTDDGQLFLVMELLTGISLEAALRRQTPPLTLHEFATIMLEVGDALAAAHRAGIVHRDLKPTNIFLHEMKDGSVAAKLLDFGVSKFLEEDMNHALTVAGTVLGSPLYMSPEQARGETNLDGRTDVFAFGAILFEGLCGYRAYEAKNFNALIVKIATTKPKSIDASAPHVPESLRRVVRACMETDPKARAQTLDDVIGLVRAAMPELERSPIRLPTPLIAVDPDAAPRRNGGGDRPPRFAPHVGDTIQGVAPASTNAANLGASPSTPPNASSDAWAVHPSSAPSGASWQTPNTSYATIVVSPPPRRSRAWVAGAAAALVTCTIATGTVLAVRGRAAAAHVAAVSRREVPVSLAPTAPTETDPAADPAMIPQSEPPTVSVDALPTPRAKSDKTAGSILKGAGHLSVAASPGWCTVAIDGKDLGPTPLAAIELSAGNHQVRCRPASGKLRTASVTVQDGASSKYRFALDE